MKLVQNLRKLKKGKKKNWAGKGGAEIVKTGIYSGNPIVSTPLSNPTHISTQNSAQGEKQEKKNKSKPPERKKYI